MEQNTRIDASIQAFVIKTFCWVLGCGFALTLWGESASRFPYPLYHQEIWIQPSVQTVKKRLEASPRHEGYEPVTFSVPDSVDLKKVLFSLSRKESFKNKNCMKSPVVMRIGSQKKLTFRKQDLCWLDLEKLRRKLGKKTIDPYMILNPAVPVPSLKDLLMVLPVRFLASALLTKHKTTREIRKIHLKWLLPPPMRAQLHMYSVFRGRNCFATALSFDRPDILNDTQYNILHFPGHHHTMMNHDEFMRVILQDYVRVAPADSRYGDVFVFFDRQKWPSYQSVMHAAVKIAGPYFFHKGSKFPSSPIEFIHQKDLWKIWKKIIPQLGVMVYRPARHLRLSSMEFAWSQSVNQSGAMPLESPLKNP